MHTYAQTIHQLYDQLGALGRGPAELSAVKGAYDTATELIAARVQSSGKPLNCHCVGTASILAQHAAPLQVVAAGLLHNVYSAGDFGYGGNGVTSRNRNEMQRRVGDEVEQYLFGFATLLWKRAKLNEVLANFCLTDAVHRNVLLIRLADELEHLIGGGILYRPNYLERLNELLDGREHLLEVAERIGCPRLGLEIDESIRVIETTGSKGELITEGSALYGKVVVPRSYKKRLMRRIEDRLRRALRTKSLR